MCSTWSEEEMDKSKEDLTPTYKELEKCTQELNAKRSEQRELSEEISAKNTEVDGLKLEIEQLKKKQLCIRINRLKTVKSKLLKLIDKAEEVLRGLNLAWVGNSNETINEYKFLCNCSSLGYSCCDFCKMGHEDSLEDSLYKIDNTFIPFLGEGFRLGVDVKAN